MSPSWQRADVDLVLPMAVVRAMFERADRFDVTSGGRFDKRGASVLLWSGSDASELSQPVGCFFVRWHDPDAGHARIYRLEWDPARGGSEAEVRRAIAVLGGPQA